jgi:hypothetical protein
MRGSAHPCPSDLRATPLVDTRDSFPVTASASYAFAGPMSFTSLESELFIGQRDRDGEGRGLALRGSGAPGGVVTMAPTAPVQIAARGDIGDRMDLVVESPLTVTWHVSARFISWTTIGICTPTTPTTIGRVTIAPPTSGATPGDEIMVRAARGDGTALFTASAMLDTGDIDYAIDPATGQLGSLSGGGTFPSPGGGSTHLLLSGAVGPPIATLPNFSVPTIALLLLDPASGQIVWVPSAVPTNGIAMLTDFEGARTVGVVLVARGLAFPSGEPVVVSVGIRDLLSR